MNLFWNLNDLKILNKNSNIGNVIGESVIGVNQESSDINLDKYGCQLGAILSKNPPTKKIDRKIKNHFTFFCGYLQNHYNIVSYMQL